jgi:imidazolonepropionase
VTILIKHIRKLVLAGDHLLHPLKGRAMQDLPAIDSAFLLIRDGLISDYGRMDDLPASASADEVLDATGRLVFPSWCDSHTHLVYAASREQEFVDRIHGLSYEEIARRGGGILNSVRKLRAASEDELLDGVLRRAREIMLLGTGAVEIKSGYGLSLESELKMLRVIRTLKGHTPLTIRSTFLGAHGVPEEYAGRKEAYIDYLVQEMIPAVAEERLAEYCDVFCERGYFTQQESEKILGAAQAYGLRPKVHANQLSRSGGVEAGVNSKAISVDHLEYVDEEEIHALLGAETIPTLLPGAQWFLQLPHPPARRMIEAGLPVALASDYNPGSSPSGNMNFMISLACVQYNLTPEEAVAAATLNSAAAMDLHRSHGSISRGKVANVFITKEMPGVAFLPYSFANNPVETIVLNGKIILP